MSIYDPIAIALGMEPTEFQFSIPEDAIKTKWGDTTGQKRPGVGGGPTTTGRIFVTNGVVEKIVSPDNIPDGFYKGRLRIANPYKPVTINGITYHSGKAAAEALGVSKGMISYLRKK